MFPHIIPDRKGGQIVAKLTKVKDEKDTLKRKVVITEKPIKLKERLMTITERIRLRLLNGANLPSDDPYMA